MVPVRGGRWRRSVYGSLVFVGGVLLLVVAAAGLLLVPLVLLVVAVADLVQRSDQEWAAAQQERLAWLLVTLFVGLIGPVLYLAIARPKLEQARRTLAAAPSSPQLAPPAPPG